MSWSRVALSSSFAVVVAAGGLALVMRSSEAVPVRAPSVLPLPPTERPSPARMEPAAPVHRTPSGPTVYLHGLCGMGGCPGFLDALGDRNGLVCPTAPSPGPCGAVGRAWDGRAAAVIRGAVAERAAEAPDAVDTSHPGVLIGFSQGAYIASDLVRSHRGRYRAVAFIGANIRLTREQLQEAGVERALFAAGRNDGARAVMRETAASLRAHGYPARFVDLGRVGHTYQSAPDAPVWDEALAWLTAEQ